MKAALAFFLIFSAFVTNAANSFAVTPYLQRPATDAMTIIFFTDSACTATTTCTLKNGGGEAKTETTSGEWAKALTNNVFHLNKNDKEEKNKWNNSLYKHRVRFEGLKSNRIYNYTVTLSGGETYSNTFRTAPDRNTPIRFVSYADCETTSGHFANYTANLQKMQSRNPDLITTAGDLTARGGIQSHWDEFWMQNAGKIHSSGSTEYTDILGSVPMITAIGNHDLFDNVAHSTSGWYHDAQGEVATEKFLSYFEFNSNNVPYKVRDGTNIPETRDMSQLFHREDYGPVTLIFLDTNNGKDCKDQAEDEKTSSNGIHDQDTNYCKYNNTNHEHGGMNRWKGARHPDFNPGSLQYTWLTNQLADAQQKSRFTFVFNHHCPYSVGGHNKSWSTGEDASALAVRVLTETMVRYGVDGWYCGHDELLEHSITNGYEILPNGQRRKHTLSIYDLGCSGDSARNSSGADNPLKYWQGSGNYGGTGSYGFLETDVTTNKLGQWTCTITPVQGSSGNYVSGSQIVYVENPNRGEEVNDLVYAEYAKTKPISGVSSMKPSDWLAWEKPPEGPAWDESVEVELSEVTAADLTYNGAEQMPRLAVKAGDLDVPSDYYTVSTSPSPVKNASSYSVTVTGAGNVKGAKTVSFKVVPAQVTVTANPASKEFGTANPQFDATVTGLQGDDTKSCLAYSFACAADESTPAGSSVDIMPTGAVEQDNYIVEYIPGKLTVTKPQPRPSETATVTASITYGQMLSAADGSVSGTMTNAQGVELEGTFAFKSGTTRPPSGTSTHVAVFTPDDDNYDAVEVDVEVTVAKATLTVKPVNMTVRSGDPAPDYAFDFEGFVNGDTKARVSGKPVFSCDYTTASEEGATHEIRVTGVGTLSAADYDFVVSSAPATLTVTKKVDEGTKWQSSYTIQEGETTGVIWAEYLKSSVAQDRWWKLAGGNTSIAAPEFVDANPSEPKMSGCHTNHVRFTFTGVTAGTTTWKAYTFTDGGQEAAHTYPGYDSPNPSMDGKTHGSGSWSNGSGVSITITVTPRPRQIVSATAANARYTGNVQTPTVVVTAEGGVTVPAGSFTVGAWSPSAPKDVGTYTATVTSSSQNYFGETTVSFTINPAQVTVTADDKSKQIGAADPEFTATVTGAVAGETIDYTVKCDHDESVGTYAITVTGAAVQGGGNYNVAFVDGRFTIKEKTVFEPGQDAVIEVLGPTTVDVGEKAISVGKVTVRGTGDLTISNYQNLTPSSVDLTGLSGTVTYEYVSSSESKSLPSGLDTTIRNTTDEKKVKYAFRGTTAANGWNLGSWTAAANFPVKTHLVLDEGTHKWEVDNSGTNQKFGENGTDDDPTLLVKRGAVLTMYVHDFSGYQGAYAEGGVVRVNDGGTLNFVVRTSGSYFDFNYRQRLYLEPGSLMTFGYPSSSNRKFALHGGVSTDPAKMQIYVPASETDQTAKPAVIRQASGSCALMTHGNSSNRYPGFAAFVGENSKLKIEASLNVGEGTATDDSKLAKYGAGELEITGTVTSIGVDAVEGVITLPADGGKFNGRFYNATKDITYRFPSGWASGAAYTLGSGKVTGTAPAANAATVYVGSEKLTGATLSYSGATVKYVTSGGTVDPVDPPDPPGPGSDAAVTLGDFHAGMETNFTTATQATLWNCKASDENNLAATVVRNDDGTATVTIRAIYSYGSSLTVKVYSGSSTAGSGTLVRTITFSKLLPEERFVSMKEGDGPMTLPCAFHQSRNWSCTVSPVGVVSASIPSASSTSAQLTLTAKSQGTATVTVSRNNNGSNPTDTYLYHVTVLPGQPRFSVTPYLQHPAPTEMTIRFFTAQPYAATVTCNGGTFDVPCEEATDLVKVASDDQMVWGEKYYKYSIRLTGLAPNTDYPYEVALEDGETYSNVFRTAPDDLDTPVRFVAYSDSECIPTSYAASNDGNADSKGCTKEWDVLVNGQNQTKTYYVPRSDGFAANLAYMAAWKPNLYVVAGDLVARGGVQMFWDEYWKEMAGGLGRGYGDPAGAAPILAVMGNHDHYDNKGSSALNYNTSSGEYGLKKFLTYFEFNPNGVDYESSSTERDSRDKSQLFHRMDYGPVTLLFLDTNKGGSAPSDSRAPSFAKGSLQYQWLEANLKDARDVRKSRFIFVVNHQCPYSRGKHNKPQGNQSSQDGQSAAPVREALTPLLLEYHVTAWLGGHDEMQEHAQVKGDDGYVLNVYDLGSGGDGLKGQHIYTDNDKYMVFSAYDDSPDGTHYGHLRVEAKPIDGTWYCSIVPAYSYFASATSPSELRFYKDKVVIDEDGEIVYQERLGAAGGVDPTDPSYCPPSGTPADLSPSGTVELLTDKQKEYLAKSVEERRAAAADANNAFDTLFCYGSAVTLSWTGTEGACKVKVTRCSDDKVVFAATVYENAATVCNLELGAEYEWTVTSGDSDRTASARFRTSDAPPRLIKCGRMKMLRDLGGWTGLQGCRISQNLLFRGAAADVPETGEYLIDSDADRDFFWNIVGLKNEVDLRNISSTSDVASSSKKSGLYKFDPAGQHVTYNNFSIENNVIPTSGKLVSALRLLTNPDKLPAYFHCKSGRDRTGTCAAILLAVLGVSRDDILRDYQTTSDKDNLERTDYNGGFLNFLDVKLARYRDASASLAENAAAYLKDCGFSEDEIETFREKLLVDYLRPGSAIVSVQPSVTLVYGQKLADVADKVTGTMVNAVGTVVTGTYVFTNGNKAPSVAESGDYEATFRPSTTDVLPTAVRVSVTVEPAKLTSATAPSQTYDSTAKTPVVTVKADDLTVPKGSYEITAWDTPPVNAVTHKATVRGTGNFEGEVFLEFTINPKPVTVAANPLSKEYGTADPELTATVKGLVEGESAENLLEYEISREAGESYGTYLITPSGDAVQGNYAITYQTAFFTITKAQAHPVDKLTVSIVYGQRLGAITEVVGKMADRTGKEIDGTFVFADSSLLPSVAQSGEFSATFKPEDDVNYGPSEVKVLVTVMPRELIVKAADAAITYGERPPDFSCVYSGFVNNENSSVVSGTCRYSCDYQLNGDVGKYDITVASVEGLSAANYRLTPSAEKGTLTVSPKPVIVTAAPNQGKVYGEEDPALAAVITDAAGTALADDLVKYNPLSRTAGENAGSYTIIVSGEENQGNYRVTFKNGTFTVNKATIKSATAEPMSYTGSTLVPAIIVTTTGGIEVDANEDCTVGSWRKSGSTWGTATLQAVGTYTATVSAKSGGNLTGSATVSFTITKADYDMGGVIFADKKYTYDGKAKTVTVTGTLPSGIRATYANNSRTDAGEQTVTVTFSGADGNHNNPSAMTATLTIDPATLTSASAASQVFTGRALTPVVTARAGTLEAKTIAVTGWDGNLTDVGTYHGKVTGTGNFTGTVDVAFAVIRAKAVVKADDKSKGYGEDDPVFTATVTGTIGSDQLTYSFDREQGDDFGSYAITPKGAAEQGNYSVSYQPGTLTVTKAVPKPDGAITATIEYGTKLAAATVSGKMKHKGEVSGTFTFLQPEIMPTVQESGRQYEAIFTANDADNYSPATVMVTVTVAKKGLTVKAANASVTYGSESPSYQFVLSGFIPGEDQASAGVTGSPDYSSAYTKTTPVGECKFSVESAGTLKADNYSFVIDTSPATLKVTPRTVTVTSLPAEKIYGEVDPKFTATVMGMANGEGEGLIKYEFSRAEGDDVRAGGYVITPKGETEQGNYAVRFKADGVLTIKPATITSATAAPMPWTGSVISPVIVVKADKLDVPATTGYTLGNWKKDGKAGTTWNPVKFQDIATYTATVTGTGNFTGTANLEFKIVKADYDMSGVCFESATVTYDGNRHSLAVTDLPSGVTIAGYSAQNLVNAGIYEITVTFKNGDTTHYNTPASRTAKLTILPAALTSATAANQTYAGKELKPVVTAKAGSSLTATTFTVGEWDGNLTDAKTYHATVTGTGNFAGTVPVEFTIDPAAIKEATAEDRTYDGEKKTPVLTVRAAGELTLEPSDYDLSAWSGGLVAAGAYTATVTGKGNYTGEAGVTFTIRKATYDMSGVTFADATVTYDRKPHELLIAGDLPTGVTVTYVGNGQTDVGEFTITAKFTGDADNYEPIADKTAKLTINKAEIMSATVAAATYTGKSQTPKLTVKATGDLTLSATDYSLSSWQGDLTNAGSCTATVTGQGNFTGFALVTFTISRAPLTVKADDQGVEKGTNPPEFTVTYSGFVNGEGENVLRGELKFSCSYVTTAPAGATFAITPSGLTADNYDIAFQDGTLEVGKSTPKLESLTAKPITYGEALSASTLTGKAKDEVKGEFAWASEAIRAIRPTVAESGRAYDVIFTPEDTDNYTVAHFKATVAVEPKELTVEAADTNVTYGAVAPDYSCTIRDFVDGEDESVVTGARKLMCPYKPFDNAGTYAITPDLSTFDADNYTFRAVLGTLTVDKATLTVSAKDLEVTYWDAPPAYAATYSGFLGTDTVSVVTGKAEFVCEYEQGSAVGGYSISVTDVSDLKSSNYAFVASDRPGVLTVGRKSVTVAADNLTKAYGEADPEPLPATVTGTVGVESVVYEVTRAAGEDVGTYAITASGDAEQGNYEVTYKSGKMTITKATLEGVDLAATLIYGQVLGEVEIGGMVKSSVTGQPVKGVLVFADPKAAPVVAGGDKTYDAVFTPEDTKSYETVTLPVRVTVERAILTVEAVDEAITYGDAPPATHARKITGFVNDEDESVIRGDCRYAPTYAQYGDVGSYPIDVDVSQLAADNYDFVAADPAGQLTVSPRPATITAKDASKTYGESDPTFELLSVEGTVNGDALTNGFTRVAGEDVREGGYEIRPTGDAVQGNYAVTYVPATLTINPAEIYLAYADAQEYTGLALTPQVVVETEDGRFATYALDPWPEALIEAKRYRTKVHGTGNFTGEVPLTFEIRKADYDLRGITFEDSVVTYDGKPHSLAIGGTPPAGLAIEYLNGDQTEAGTYTVTAEFKVDNNHNAPNPWTASLTIKPATLTSATAASQPYDGTVKKPVLTVKSGELTVTTYSLGSWGKEELQRVGTYTATVEGSGNFAGKVSVLFTITRATATIVIDNKLKEYGEDDPEWTAAVKGLFNDDSVKYEPLSRAKGEEPGSYAIRTTFNEIQGNYSVSAEEGVLTIAKATPSVSEAPTATMTYGEELGDAEIRGSMKGHQGEAVDGRFQFKDPDFEPTVAESGKFAAVFIPNDTVHYQEVEIDIDVRVAKRELSVWAKDATIIYGDEPPPPDDYDYFCRGFVFGDSQSVVTGACSYACEYEKNGSVGEYPITVTDVSELFASNYCFAIDQTTNGNLRVGRKAVTVTANNTGKPYGANDPKLTVTIEGRVDEADEIHYSISRQGGVNVGDYAITPTGDAEQKNYVVTYKSGTFTIAPAEITGAKAVSQTYDGAVKTPVLTVTAGELTATYDLGEWSPSELKTAGTYTNTVTGTGNFCGKRIVVFTIEKATYDMSGVTFADGTITYDGKFHALAIDGDLPDGVTVTYAGGGTDVGTYDVTATFAGDANHKPIDMRMAKLTIAPKPVTVRADRATKTYGSNDPDFTATVEGLRNGDSLKYEFERTPFGEEVSSAYAVKPVGEEQQGNYAVTYVAAGFEITKAQLVVSPVGAVIRYGGVRPAFGCTYAAFAFDDDASVVSGACAFRCDYEAGDAPGDYAVFVESVDGLSAANYTFVASPSPATLRVLSVEESSVLNAFEHFAEIGVDPMTGGWTLTLTNDVSSTVELLDDLGEVVLDLNGRGMAGADGAAGEDGEPAIRIVASGLSGAPTALAVRDSSEASGWIRGGRGGDPSGRGGAGVSVPTNALAGVSVTVEDAVRDRVVGGAGGDPDGLPGLAIDNPLASRETFIEVLNADSQAKEGESILIRVDGGSYELASSVQLQAVYNTAAAADLDLKNAMVNDVVDAAFKFPYTLTWARGDVRAQIIEIPVKAQTTAKADRDLTFALQNPMNAKLRGVGGKSGNGSQCKVTILGGLGPVTDKVSVRAVPNDATRGKTSGSALVVPGKKVTVKATANKGFAFTGWEGLEGLGSLEGLDSRSASISFSAPTNDVDLVARFEPLAADYLELTDDFLPEEIELGEVFSNAVTVASGSLPTITVSGLPTGLKYYVKETVVTDSKTKEKTIVPANTIYGIPTKASATNKTSGAVTPSKVKVTVKNLGGYKVVRTYSVCVTARTTELGSAPILSDDKPFAAVTVALSDDAAGKVTGAGLYQAGKKVTVKATANKGYVFAKWEGLGGLEGLDLSKANLSFVMPSNNVSLVAKFVLPGEIPDPTGKNPWGVAVVRNNDFAGNVTGAGYYAAGKKVTLKATANKGYVFSGWYRDAAFEDQDHRITQDASYVIASMPASNVCYYARFVTAGEDLASIVTAVNGMALAPGSGKDSASPLPTNVMCGVDLRWPVVSTALSLPKVSVSGLPSGLKFTAKDIMVKGSKTEVDVPANTIYGAPTAASKPDKPSAVKVTVTTSGKSKAEYRIDLTVDPLPAWAVGTFDGPYVENDVTNGVVKLTVAASGKISGTVQTNCTDAAAKKLTLSAASFADYDLETKVFTLKPTYKDGKETVEVPLTLSGAVVEEAVTNGVVDGESLVAYQNVLKGAAADVFTAPTLEAYTNLTLTAQKDGVLKVAGKVEDSTGKLISASGSSQIYYDADEKGYRAVIYLPSKKGFDGVAEIVEVEGNETKE